MNFLEYIIMFNRIKRDNDILFMVSENNFCEYKVGDVVIISGFSSCNIVSNVFVIIDNNNLAIPIDFFYFISNDFSRIDYIYQLDDKKIIKKIGKVSNSVISDYKRRYILLSRSIESEVD